MNRCRRLLLALGLGAAAVGIAGRCLWPPLPRAAGPLPQALYVWQRRWDTPVRDALLRAAPRSAGFVYLGAEIAWENGQPRVARVGVDLPALAACRRPVGAALRVGPYGGPFDGSAPATRLVVDAAVHLAARARAAGVDLAEFQIDFDCAEARLAGYGEWLALLRARLDPLPLVFTALPSWLDRPAFRDLAACADSFVLQVHSVERPARADAAVSLCDAQRARAWVEAAARFGRPFRVALPTYGYLLRFDAQGRFQSLAAENAPRACAVPAAGTVRVLEADAPHLAGLVRGWEADRPANLEGILWYRLPVEGERLNWPWPTLAAVMDGRAPAADLRVEVRAPAARLFEVVLANAGSAAAALPAAVHAAWSGAPLAIGDGVNGYALETGAGARARFSRPVCGRDAAVGLDRLAPGAVCVIGWLRLDGEGTIRADLGE